MLLRFSKSIRRFFRNEEGPTAVEYAVMLALIVVVCLTAIRAVGANAKNTFDNTKASMDAAPTFGVGSTSPGYTAVPAVGTWSLSLSGGTTVSYAASTGVETTYWGGGGTAVSNGPPGFVGSDRGQLWTRIN